MLGLQSCRSRLRTRLARMASPEHQARVTQAPRPSVRFWPAQFRLFHETEWAPPRQRAPVPGKWFPRGLPSPQPPPALGERRGSVGQTAPVRPAPMSPRCLHPRPAVLPQAAAAPSRHCWAEGPAPRPRVSFRTEQDAARTKSGARQLRQPSVATPQVPLSIARLRARVPVAMSARFRRLPPRAAVRSAPLPRRQRLGRPAPRCHVPARLEHCVAENLIRLALRQGLVHCCRRGACDVRLQPRQSPRTRPRHRTMPVPCPSARSVHRSRRRCASSARR